MQIRKGKMKRRQGSENAKLGKRRPKEEKANKIE